MRTVESIENLKSFYIKNMSSMIRTTTLLILFSFVLDCSKFVGNEDRHFNFYNMSIKGHEIHFLDTSKTIPSEIIWKCYKSSRNTEDLYRRRLKLDNYVVGLLTKGAYESKRWNMKRAYEIVLENFKQNTENINTSIEKWPIVMVTKAEEQQNAITRFVAIVRYGQGGIELACIITFFDDQVSRENIISILTHFVNKFERDYVEKRISAEIISNSIFNEDGAIACEQLSKILKMKDIDGKLLFVPVVEIK
jgi:hypothetical protein